MLLGDRANLLRNMLRLTGVENFADIRSLGAELGLSDSDANGLGKVAEGFQGKPGYLDTV